MSKPESISEFTLANSSSRQPSVSRDNGKRLGWSSVMLRAAAGVAQESNPGMTVFATVVADVWGRWVGILSLFPPRSFLFHLFVSLLLSSSDSCLRSLTPAAAILGKRFPAASVDVCEFEVALADVLEAQRGAAYWASPHGKLPNIWRITSKIIIPSKDERTQ